MPAGPGRPKGMKNKRTLIREQRIAEAAEAVAKGEIDISKTLKDGVEVMEDAMLYFFVLAEQERRKERGNKAEIKENLKLAADIAKDVAKYHRPQLSAVRMGGDPDNITPIKLETLTDAQLDFLIDRLLQGVTPTSTTGTPGGAGSS